MCDTDQQSLVTALQNPDVYPHAADHLQLIETHISWVILSGAYAYKIKKALNLGFLDFTTLGKRRFYCEEELRLNSRLASALYLAVVPIEGPAGQPTLGGAGRPIEYAVKMHRFPQAGLLSHMAHDNRLEAVHIDQLVKQVAQFHSEIPSAEKETIFNDPAQVMAQTQDNFDQIRACTNEPRHVQWVHQLRHWAISEHRRCYPYLAQRKQQGFVRECHGDMHLGNITLIDGIPVIFDGVEFNPELYWIDVMSEIAFLLMDLDDHGKHEYAYRFLNGYMDLTGDYSGLQVLRYYQAYRAAVRAKIASIRLTQDLTPEAESGALTEFEHYLHLALSYTQPQHPVLFITHGLSGSGKSTLTAPLAEQFGAIRIRSDRERLRLFPVGERIDSAPKIDAGAYSPDASLRTYAKLERLSEEILRAGYSVIIDATFLERSQRAPFERLASRLAVPIRILSFQADAAELKQRVESRLNEGQDISEADLNVLQHQLDNYVGLGADEHSYTIVINTQAPDCREELPGLVMRSLPKPDWQVEDQGGTHA